jgi:SAM-dependent methyltransferase
VFEADRKSDFNSLADDYAKFRTSYSDELFDAILGYARVPPGGKVLDLACGTWLGMMPYVRRGFSVVGVDVAPAMIEQARHIVPRSRSASATVQRGAVSRHSRALDVALRREPHDCRDLAAHSPSHEIALGKMDPAISARQRGLLGSVAEGCPRQQDIARRDCSRLDDGTSGWKNVRRT